MNEIKISLLPEDIKKRSMMLKKWGMAALVVLIITVFIVFANFILSVSLKGKITEAALLENENEMLEENIKSLSYIDALNAENQKLDSLITKLKDENTDWNHIIKTVTNNNTLYGINLEQMKINENIIITGTVKDIDKLRVWADDTRSIEGVSEVVLSNFTQKTDSRGYGYIYFEANIGVTVIRGMKND